MVTLSQLWLPILLSAVFIFVVSSLIHMVFKWHNGDYQGMPHESSVRQAMNQQDLQPGMYVIPHCKDMKDMGSPEMTAKYQEGPVAMVFLRAKGAVNMGKSLGQWFLLSLAVAFSVAYVASRTLPMGTHYLQVFRVTGAITFLAYAPGSIIAGIWMGQPWRAVLKDVFDALLYALVSAGAFGWRWPH